MASSRLPNPGAEFGPCVDEACGHIDCEGTRALAAWICKFCREPIGYMRGFYQLDDEGNKKVFVHSSCYEESIEQEAVLDPDYLNVIRHADDVHGEAVG